MSAQLGFRFMIPYNLPFSGTGITGAKMTGWALTPEFRFYPGKHDEAPAPHGFYIGLYGRYSKLNLNVGTSIDDPMNPGFQKVTDIKIGLSHLGGGLIIGRQWAKNAFSVDWWIIAGGAGTSSFNASVTDPIFKNKDAADELTKAFSSSDNALFSPTIAVDTNSGTINISQTTTGFNIRSIFVGGLCFGYHF